MITAALLIELGIKSLVVAGATLGVLRLARGRSAAERSWIGHAGLIALILIVPAALLMPSWNPLPAPVQTAAVTATAPAIFLPELAQAKLPPGEVTGALAPATDTAAQYALPSTGELAVWLYALPLALLLLAMAVAVIRLSAMHRRSNILVESAWLEALAHAQQRMGFKHGTALLVSDELRSPVSWGMMRPIIVLNRDAVAAVHEAEPIIAHELAHVARLDWAKLLIARVACALFWFNPLVWRLARECHQLREEAADDAVLLSDVDGADYASLLVSAARHDNRALLLAAHGVAPAKDSLKRRITRVLDAGLSRGPANRAWMALCMVALLGIAGPLAALDPTASSTKSAPVVRDDAPLGIVQQTLRTVVPAAVQAALQGVPVTQLANHDGDRDENAEEAGDPRVDRLIELRATGMTDEYVAQMRAAGFTDASLDDLTGARAVGVTPAFAQQMRRLAPGIDLDTVVEARAVGLSPEFYGDMRRLFPHLTLDDAVGLRAVGVNGAYVSEMRQLFPGVTADQLQELRAVNVTPAFVRAMRAEGLAASDPDEAVEGRVVGSKIGEAKVLKRGDRAIAIAPGGAISISGPEGNISIAAPDDPDGE
jgi:beta-lactamase regulating signal transducer with metallopeptidase domain